MVTKRTAQEPLFKILLLGDTTVGKSCVLMRFTDQTFQDIHMATIGLDFKIKQIKLENKVVKVQIWDTAGQDRFRAITKNYYRGANGIILIYDITKKQTFDNIRNWVSQIREEASNNVVIFLVGNKIDMEDKREVKAEDGEKLATNLKISFFEVSAKTGDNIDKVFLELVKEIDKIYSNDDDSKVLLKRGKNKNSGCCGKK